MDLILKVVYILVAIAMVAMILLQRGAGAQAGSGFGAGASATVFGARGASNFLSKSTKWLAIVFFAITMYMAWSAAHRAKPGVDAVDSSSGIGLMEDVARRQESDKKAPAQPAIPVQTVPAPEAPAQQAPAPQPAPAAQPEAPATGAAPAQPTQGG